MFAARGGFIYFEEAAPAGVPAWQTMTPAEITSEVSTWELTGSRSLDTSFALGTTIFNVNGAYRGAVLHPNGNVYLAPATKSTNNILEIDLDNSVATEIDTGQTLSGAVKFAIGSLGNDGKIYYLPYDYNKVLIVDPPNASYTIQDWGLSLSGSSYTGAVTVGDKIYGIGKSNFIVIDTAANTAYTTTYGILSGTTLSRNVSSTRSIADGCVYFGPYANTHIIRIDPVNNVASSSNYGITFPTQSSQGICNGKDGNIYITRHNNITNNHKLNPLANTITTVGGSSTRGLGAVLGYDGNVYIGPGGASGNSSWIDVTSNTGATSPSFMPNTDNRWGLLLANNRIWSFPNITSNTNVVPFTITGTGSSSEWSANIALSSYGNRMK